MYKCPSVKGGGSKSSQTRRRDSCLSYYMNTHNTEHTKGRMMINY